MHDLIIIGAGPAGMTAAIYAARYKLNTIIISQDVGGLVNEAHLIENWPGVESISGVELMHNFRKHVEKYSIPIIEEEVIEVKRNDQFLVSTKNKTYESKTLIFALGTKRKKLNVPGEDNFAGKGVSYCFTCDAPIFRNKIVAMIGGGDSAAKGSLLLSEYAKKVYLIVRSELKAEPMIVENINKKKNIEIIKPASVVEISGDKVVRKIKLNNGKEIEVNGVFIEIGHIPSTTLAKEIGVNLNEHGEIIVDDEMRTNIKGVFAAGDITNKSSVLRQIITASAQGAIAALSAYKFVKGINR